LEAKRPSATRESRAVRAASASAAVSSGTGSPSSRAARPIVTAQIASVSACWNSRPRNIHPAAPSWVPLPSSA
jgi:hypothetical protein